MESVKLSVQTDHKVLMRASIFCRCVTNVKTLNSGCGETSFIFLLHEKPSALQVQVQPHGLDTRLHGNTGSASAGTSGSGRRRGRIPLPPRDTAGDAALSLNHSGVFYVRTEALFTPGSVPSARELNALTDSEVGLLNHNFFVWMLEDKRWRIQIPG